MSGPIQIDESPPLADWLKGRIVLTVAQDGSGQFRTIKAALDAVQSSQAVRVLDRGPYRERLELHSPPADIGLISDVQTRIELAELAPGNGDAKGIGHFFDKCNRLRVQGFEFLIPQVLENQVTIGIHVWQPRGVVFEDCAVRRKKSARSRDQGAVTLGDGSTPKGQDRKIVLPADESGGSCPSQEPAPGIAYSRLTRVHWRQRSPECRVSATLPAGRDQPQIEF